MGFYPLSRENGSGRLSHRSNVTQQGGRFSFLLQVLSSALRFFEHSPTWPPFVTGSLGLAQGSFGSQPWPGLPNPLWSSSGPSVKAGLPSQVRGPEDAVFWVPTQGSLRA